MIEAISRRVLPAQGYRKGSLHQEGWLIIERRHGDNQTELRYFFSNMPQDMPTREMVRLFHERLATAKRIEASILSAGCPTSSLPLSDANVDLPRFIYMSGENQHRYLRIMH